MKRLLLFAAVSLSLAAVAQAQDKSRSTPLRRDATPIRPAAQADEVMTERISLTQTPEMWFYEQERLRWDDPQSAVRRKAEFRAAQRAQRIASSQWYGISNARPGVNPTPYFGTYGPTWTANSLDPNRWRIARDTANTTVIVR